MQWLILILAFYFAPVPTGIFVGALLLFAAVNYIRANFFN